MANGKITKRLVDSLIGDATKAGKTLYCWDSDLTGFGVLATKTGAASYFVEYRLGGRETPNKRVSIGKHGALAPDGARKLAKEKLGEVAKGRDVAQEKREARHKLATALTFAEVLELYLSTNGADNRSWGETRRLLEFDALPALGKRPMASLTVGDATALIDTVAARAPSVARALFAALRPFCKWAKKRGHIPINPLADLDAPPKPKARKRTLKDQEIKAFWKGTEALGWPFGPAFQLLLLTGQREEEVGGLEWAELNGAEWIIPEGRAKNGLEHAVDLSPQACAILAALPRMLGQAGRSFAFTTTGSTSISGWSKAKARLDGLMCADLGGDLWARFQAAGANDAAACKLGFADAKALRVSILPPWRLHDLRRTAATGMQSLGVDIHVVERVLNHISGKSNGGMVGVYQHFEYRTQRKEALLLWGKFVEDLVNAEAAASNVVELRASA